MLDEHTIRDGHLTPEALAALACGAFDNRDTALLICHLEACPACMDAYIEAACAAGTDQPEGGYPALESRILTAVTRESRRSRGRTIAVNIAKMSVAVALTMLLFFSGAFRKLEESTSYILQQITTEQTAAPPSGQAEESRFDRLASGYNTGFHALVDRIQAFFIGDDEHEHE